MSKQLDDAQLVDLAIRIGRQRWTAELQRLRQGYLAEMTRLAEALANRLNIVTTGPADWDQPQPRVGFNARYPDQDLPPVLDDYDEGGDWEYDAEDAAREMPAFETPDPAEPPPAQGQLRRLQPSKQRKVADDEDV